MSLKQKPRCPHTAGDPWSAVPGRAPAGGALSVPRCGTDSDQHQSLDPAQCTDHMREARRTGSTRGGSVNMADSTVMCDVPRLMEHVHLALLLTQKKPGQTPGHLYTKLERVSRPPANRKVRKRQRPFQRPSALFAGPHRFNDSNHSSTTVHAWHHMLFGLTFNIQNGRSV